MKKHLVVLLTIVAVALVTLNSCDPLLTNKVTIMNKAAASVRLNIRGQSHLVTAGKTVELTDFKRGTFEYSTVYEIPAGIKSSSATGDVAGEMKLIAGTQILLIYTSVVDSAKYTLYANLTSTDDVNRVDPFEGN